MARVSRIGGIWPEQGLYQSVAPVWELNVWHLVMHGSMLDAACEFL